MTEDERDERYGRELEEDHDTLTFNESGARLRQEIEETRATLSGLADDDPEAPALQQRLDQLVESQALIQAQAQGNEGGRGFADYRPDAAPGGEPA